MSDDYELIEQYQDLYGFQDRCDTEAETCQAMVDQADRISKERSGER